MDSENNILKTSTKSEGEKRPSDYNDNTDGARCNTTNKVLEDKVNENSSVSSNHESNASNVSNSNINEATNDKQKSPTSSRIARKEKLHLEISPPDLTLPTEMLQSPSVYSSTVLECCQGSFFTAFVLCRWDHLVGPKIRHIWKLSPEVSLSNSFLHKIATQTLNSEICRDPEEPFINIKYIVLSDLNTAVSSYIFGAFDRGQLWMHSLSVLIPCEKRKAYFIMSAICAEWMKRLVGKLKIYLEKEPEETAATLFSTQLFYLMQMLLSLKEAGLPAHIPLCDSHFHPEHRIEQLFLRKAIVAHLITGGRSIVIGPTISQVNLLISTLAMFLPAKERLRCRYVSSKNSFYPYHPEIPVQGLLQDSEGQLTAHLKELYISTFPSALINLSLRDVRVSSYIHKHYLTRHKALVQELDFIWKMKRNDSYPTNDMFHVVDDPETLVKNFLDDLDLIPPTDGLKEKFIDCFVRHLEKKALSLIKYLEVETDGGKKTTFTKRKKMKQDLALLVPGDFKIVLATADKLKPGIYGFVYQDRIKDYVSKFDTQDMPVTINFSLSASYDGM